MNLSKHYNFERKYLLKQHINSNKDRRYSSGELKLLFAETSNRCGDCRTPMEWNIIDEISSKDNQIAHIYGKKLFSKSNMPLNEKYHIKSEDEINKYHNLIILCHKCHKEYDKNPTYDKYKKILDYKMNIAKRVTSKTYIYFALEDILIKIKNGAFKSLCPSDEDCLSNLQRTDLKDKLLHNRINPLKRKKSMDNMTAFFKDMRDLDENGMINNQHLDEYRKVYQALKGTIDDKNEIINIINNALIEDESSISNDLIPILTDYMIMNCEVLDNVTK